MFPLNRWLNRFTDHWYWFFSWRKSDTYDIKEHLWARIRPLLHSCLTRWFNTEESGREKKRSNSVQINDAGHGAHSQAAGIGPAEESQRLSWVQLATGQRRTETNPEPLWRGHWTSTFMERPLDRRAVSGPCTLYVLMVKYQQWKRHL